LAQNGTEEPRPRDTATAQPSPTMTPSPTITPSPTPVPVLQVAPTQAVGNQKVLFQVTGFQWPTGSAVNLFWDQVDGGNLLEGNIQPDAAGGWQRNEVAVRKAWATVGGHKIIAQNSMGFAAEVAVELIQPTPAPPTNTPLPTATPSPTFTPQPTPTLRPVTPMVTITPIPPTKAPPKAHAPTSTPRPTNTETPVPGTATFTPTPSVTPTPSITPTPTETPGPGTPVATPEPIATPTWTPTATPTWTPTATPMAVEEISDTGAGWGMVFLWGFVLAGLLVVVRLLRVRSLRGQG